MTNIEFNEEYKDYLEEGHYGLSFNVFEITEYLDNIFQDLIKIPGFKYSQIKFKFNNARFYSTLKSDLSYLIESKINSLYEEYEDRIN